MNTTKEHEPKAEELIGALHGSAHEIESEVKTIMLTFAPRARAEVTFSGEWNGRLLRSAFNAVSKAYRRRRHIKLQSGVQSVPKTQPTKGGIGDGLSKGS